MRANLRRRLEMAERVRDFLRAHQLDGIGEGLGLAKLEGLLERAEVLKGQQRAGVAMARAAAKHRRDVRTTLQDEILRYLRVVGRVAAKQKGELANQFPLPAENSTNDALLTAARKTLEQATAQKDVFVGLGMSPQVLDDLARALSEFDQTVAASREGRRDHVGASAELEAVASEITEQVQLLDGVVKYRFAKDAELLAAWHSVRNVVGPFKPKEGGGQAPKAA